VLLGAPGEGRAADHIDRMVLPLSVLDLYPVATGTPPSRALHDAVGLAKRVDELGYHRYWIAEHHNMPGIASAAPEVLIGHVAGVTKRIRVGAGGIMIPNHTPLRVVEIFRTLEALYPGRIDLGLGRAPGTDQLTASALRRSNADVNSQLAELLAFAHEGFPDDHPYRKITAQPSDTALPPIWMLGSTQAGAAIAAALGVGYAFAGHFSMSEAKSAIRRYRTDFRPSDYLQAPKAILAVTVVCAEDRARAEALALPLRVAASRLARGEAGTFPTEAEAKAHEFTEMDRAVVERFSLGAIIGNAADVRAGLERVAEELGASELMISTVITNPVERVRSYERVAEVFG